jgi:SAM-dependent methyltransferase
MRLALKRAYYRSRSFTPRRMRAAHREQLIAEVRDGKAPLLKRIYYGSWRARPRRMNEEDRTRLVADVRGARRPIQKLVIDSNDCITEMCLLGMRFPSDKSPLNVGNRYRHAYTPIYSLLFSALRGRSLDVAEIGLRHGWGLQLLREFFPEARLFGFEFHPEVMEAVADLHIAETRLIPIDVSDADSISRAFEQSGTRFDVIIDDSTHLVDHQVHVIRRCTPFLKPGGILIVEDVFDDFRAPESRFEGVVAEMEGEFSLATFIYPRNRKTHVEEWNNEKLLLLVKK